MLNNILSKMHLHLFGSLSFSSLDEIYLPRQEAHLVADPLPKGTLFYVHKQAPIVEFHFKLVEIQLHSEGLFLFFR